MKKATLASRLAECANNGIVVVLTSEGYQEILVKEFVDQPSEGILWDLNRDAATCLTILKETGEKIWVNNYASGLVIAELKRQVDRFENLESQVVELLGVTGCSNIVELIEKLKK